MRNELTSFMQGGYTMELCLTPYWSELKDVNLSLKMTYHSVQPSTTELCFVRFCILCVMRVHHAFLCILVIWCILCFDTLGSWHLMHVHEHCEQMNSTRLYTNNLCYLGLYRCLLHNFYRMDHVCGLACKSPVPCVKKKFSQSLN